jgi:hypothetical protein
MVTKININDCSNLPEPVRRKMGIGTSRIKVIQRENEEIIIKANQGLDEINIRITQLKDDKAKSIELTESELHRILLMARDIKRITSQDYQDPDNLSFSLD